MKNYLLYLSPKWCEAIVASGGEPLIYWKKVKQVFEIVDSDIHKKLMTNGLLLTQEIVDYCNLNNIEVQVSHDGEKTKELRSADPLEIPKIKDLIKQINLLHIAATITNKNCDVVANYRDTIKKLDDRENIIYDTGVIFSTPKNQHLIAGFDYELYRKSSIEFYLNYYIDTPLYFSTSMAKKISSNGPNYGHNIDLHGNVINMETLTRYGTVLNTKEELFEAAENSGDGKYCNSQSDCLIKNTCSQSKSMGSPHSCKAAMVDHIISDYLESL